MKRARAELSRVIREEFYERHERRRATVVFADPQSSYGQPSRRTLQYRIRERTVNPSSLTEARDPGTMYFPYFL